MEKVQSRGVIAFGAVLATLLLSLPFGATAPATAATGPGSNCTRRCGSIDIPYPFGIEPHCYHAAGFNLTCNRYHQPPKLFLGDGTVQVLEISIPNATVRINSSRMDFTNDVGDGRTVNRTWGAGLPRGGQFVLSGWYNSRNMLQAESCNVQVDLRGGERNELIASCTAICPTFGSQNGQSASILVGDGSCAGIRCCQANIDIGYSLYSIQMHKLKESFNTSRDPLGSVYIVDRTFNYTESEADVTPEAVPATLSWIIANNSACPANASAPECRSAHSSCLDRSIFMGSTNGYICQCSHGYQGNPYIADGCQDIDECSSSESYPCYGDCKNTPGNFVCRCHAGYKGNASVPNGCEDIDECENAKAYSCYGICQNLRGTFHCHCPNGTYGNPFTKEGCIITKNSFAGLSIGLGVGVGTSLLVVALGAPLTRKIKLRKVKKMREKIFNQNHGLLLQQLISQHADIGERMVITLRELEKATNNFDRARVIGGGGHGVVFKGILDLHVVAIKKSKIVVQREIDEFINEVAILSQVNHRNVVKLLGCCLETEVPLLVYELSQMEPFINIFTSKD